MSADDVPHEPAQKALLTSVNGLLRLRWRVTEWALAHLRGDIAYADQVRAAARAEGASGNDFADEADLLVAEYRDRPVRMLWLELARREAALADRGALDA